MSEAKEWIIPKERFLATETGRNLAEYYYEVILQRDCDREGKDREECIREWMDTFDYVEIRIFPEEERIGYIFYDAYGRLVDEYYEDLFPESLPEIVADMESIMKGKPRHSWTPWSPEEEKKA
jgi:coproporphyrinogen III oxidase